VTVIPAERTGSVSDPILFLEIELLCRRVEKATTVTALDKSKTYIGVLDLVDCRLELLLSGDHISGPPGVTCHQEDGDR